MFTAVVILVTVTALISLMCDVLSAIDARSRLAKKRFGGQIPADDLIGKEIRDA
jgi:hypothetical protein